MSSTAADAATPVRVQRLGKQFRLYRNPRDRVREWLSRGRRTYHQPFWALREVSFDVARGECLGVIGPNGSGKSTLLKLLAGALYATEGDLSVHGRILSLLELGTGVHPDLTGRENVIHGAELLGFPPGYGRNKVAEIEAFAELGDFFDRPVRLYSSGMHVRLAFSMFACFDPDVFVIDEALSVGDLFFQRKCAQRLREMRSRGVTMLLVSHDLAAVEAMCGRVMVLQNGQTKFLGDTRQGLSIYYSLMGKASAGEQPTGEAYPWPATAPAMAPAGSSGPPMPEPEGEVPWHPPDAAESAGTGAVRITAVAAATASGWGAAVIRRGEWVMVRVRYEAIQACGPVNCGISLVDRLGQLAWAAGWLNGGVEPISPAAGQVWESTFTFRADLEPGEYAIVLAASEALRDATSPTGWNQHLGGDDHTRLPRALRLAVLPPANSARRSFGPANLEYGVVASW